MPDFSPTLDNQDIYRKALGQYATGVTVITCTAEGEPMGITVNSFASVSLDPPLILWCIAKNSERFEAFTRARYFAVHVLPKQNASLCAAFAEHSNAFDQVAFHPSVVGVPLLVDYLCRLACTTHVHYDGGDHRIILGKVTQVSVTAGQPLVFAQDTLGAFHPSTV